MSRLGKMPILIPAGVTVNVDGLVNAGNHGTRVVVKGPKGELTADMRSEIDVKVEGSNVVTSIKQNSKNSGAYWGLTRALVANMIKGVTEGFQKQLELVGVGYRVKQNGSDGVTLSLGFSHPVEFKAEKGVTLEVGENQTIDVKGADKNMVGLTAAKIRKLKKPEPYKGKGIKYAGEVIRRKAGKAAKTAK
jgi:large subunit ribosomal protein L6